METNTERTAEAVETVEPAETAEGVEMPEGNRKSITIAYFAAPSDEGKELYRMMEDALNGVRGHPVELRLIQDCAWGEVGIYCLFCDVVIFDGSIDGANGGGQYQYAMELMKGLDHVLVVSRTELPYNFEGMRKGGAPRIVTGVTEQRTSMTNQEIRDWLLDTLENSNMELPRTIKYRPVQGVSPFSDPEENRKLMKTEARLMTDSIERAEPEKPFAFVSYLSRTSKFYQPPGTLPYVEDLFPTIQETCGLPDTSGGSIRYFPPGQISLEFMTPQRRFEIVSLTEKFIGGCKAFWIYAAPGYNASWWAYGERMSLLHIYRENMEACPDIYAAVPVQKPDGDWGFRVRAYRTAAEKRAFLFQLTRAEEKELNMLWINANPDSVGYEKVKTMRALSKLPDFLLNRYLRFQADYVTNMTLSTFALAMEAERANGALSEEEEQEALENIRTEMGDFDGMKAHVRSFTYTKSFWEDHLVECPLCRAVSKDSLTPERYMRFTSDYFVFIPPRQYQRVVEQVDKEGTCTLALTCKEKHTVTVRKCGKPRWRWWTMSAGRPSGPNGVFLEKLDFLEILPRQSCDGDSIL